ncbi:MAG: PD-(D/E)XK nuclease family protein [Bacteroidales bacterium]|nr:PD-(D/E)XK nuclease family protein [Bacteroidales bacterium]
MTLSFLGHLAQHILGHIGDDLRDVCVVLPNKRAGLYLRKEISSLIGTPVWSPHVLTIEEFVSDISGVRIADDLILLFDLFEIHRKLTGDKGHASLREFAEWGQMIISDFNDIDLCLADPGKIFSYLSDAKAIALWNPDKTPLTAHERNYLEFYRSLIRYYNELHDVLIRKGLGYQGMASRLAVEKLKDGLVLDRWKSVVFAGFNALSPAEEKVMEILTERRQARIFWDADRYYAEDEDHEAGRFLRKFMRRHGSGFLWMEDHFTASSKKINILGVPGFNGQAQVAGKLIRDIISCGEKTDDTALVLNDNQMLLPLLNAIADQCGHFNVTMGIPLSHSVFYSLIESLLDLHDHPGKPETYVNNRLNCFYFKDLIRLFSHSSLLIFSENNGNGLKALPAILRKTGKAYFPGQELIQLCGLPLHSAGLDAEELFCDWNIMPLKALQVMCRWLEVIKGKYGEINAKDNSRIQEFEQCDFTQRMMIRIRNLAETYSCITTLEDMRAVIRLISRQFRIPLHGEPLKGLQVMGMLETRSIDFRNIIMLSVNEDFLPAHGIPPTFIPVDIRREFGLSLPSEHHAIYAYHFYRLMQRAENIWLLYNTEPGGLGGGEMSRFITQLLHEMPHKAPGVQITEEIVSFEPQPDRHQTVTINKVPDIMNQLLNLLQSGLSSTAMTTYLQCSLRFYFRYVARIMEPQDVAESVEDHVLGTVIHDVLKHLYNPWIGKAIPQDAYRNMAEKIPELLKNSFKIVYPGGDMSSGRNKLMMRVTESMIIRYLEAFRHTQDTDPWEVFYLEKKLISFTETNIFKGKSLQANFTGILDRVDRRRDEYRIIDYKTGNVQKRDLVLKSWGEIREENKSKVFQLLLYSWLLERNTEGEPSQIRAGIISMRQPESGILALQVPEGTISESTDKFRELLGNIVDELIDDSRPFIQTGDADACRYCPYSGICFRQVSHPVV